MSNTVNPKNFNDTMDGYMEYAIKSVRERMSDKEEKITFTQDEIDAVIRYIRSGFFWAKDTMSMSEARKYNNK